MPAQRLLCIALLILDSLVALGACVRAEEGWPRTLEGTQPLILDEPLDVVMVRGIGRYAEAELARSPARRQSTWPAAKPGSKAYEQWAEEQRVRLRTLIGSVDERSPVSLSRLANPSSLLSRSDARGPRVMSVRWDVLEGVTAEGLLLIPAGDAAGYAVAIPDADWTPEMFCGLTPGVAVPSQLPRRLVNRGIAVLVPALINRDDTYSGHPDIRETNIPHRELIYRMSFEMGRHIIGFEVQKVLAAIDVLEPMAAAAGNGQEVAVCGVGDGGQLALYAAALDRRIGPSLVCGYFQERERVWEEPIDRNIWSQLQQLGDAEIAALAAPGELCIEACAAPSFDGPRPAGKGRPDFAAPGTIETPPLESVRREFARLRQLAEPQQVMLIETPDGHGPAGSSDVVERFAKLVRGSESEIAAERPLPPPDVAIDPDARQRRQLDELKRFVQRLLHRSDKVRAAFWSQADTSSVEAWAASTDSYRRYVHEEMIGRLPLPAEEPKPRSRKLMDEPTHVGYEVVLEVYSPESNDTGSDTGAAGVIAGGILLLPADLQEGERRPVVVCQHGLEGTPMDTITTDPSLRAWQAYKGFATQLVKRGFIVYAPQNPYRGEHDFRVLQRQSNPLGRSLFSYIIEQHRQTLRWLGSLPWVDAERIGFYGLSYGGKTAVRVPPLLVSPAEQEQRETSDVTGGTRHTQHSTFNSPVYCLSICSADFNEWIRKNVSSEDRYSYVFTREYEMFEWNMGHVAGYAELASLMIPRPFMVERGHDDGVAPDEWVAWEYAKVRRLYDKLGIGERTEIEFFNGPHTINGQGTFEFLHRHLDWPLRPPAVR